ncbi:MAG: sigma-54 dependent transcriptional regulator [Spirochaetales bacterium]
MNRATVLVVDDEKSIRLTLKMLLEDEGYRAVTAESGEEALSLIEETVVDVLVTDLRMPGMSGLELLDQVKTKDPSIEVIFISAYSDVGSAVQAIKRGAFDYIPKSFRNEEFLITIEKALEKKKLLLEYYLARRQIENRYSAVGYLFRDRKMQVILQALEKIARTNATVLITGESGTGKEVLAKIIHEFSPRKDKPFSVMDCSSIPPTLLESELFGYEKGAFTGANARKIGKFEAANGGTLFLDEIGELPLSMQTRFLRILQEKQFERVGGNQSIALDLRFIAATNKNLEQEVKEGRFREDLYYRLNICRIAVPPLRERKEDIPLLAEHFLQEFSREHNKTLQFLGVDLLLYLMEYPFPGNVRELRNMIEQAVILAGDTEEALSLNALPIQKEEREQWPGQVLSIPSDQCKLWQYEKYIIEHTLRKYKGNKQKVAQVLGIKRQTLYNKLKRYGIVDTI